MCSRFPVRRVHNSGHNHLANVRDYYANIDQVQAQEIIDVVAKDYDSRKVPRPTTINSTDVRMMGLNGPRAARGLTQVPISGAPIRLGVGDSGFIIGAPPGVTPPPVPAPVSDANPGRGWGSTRPAPPVSGAGPPLMPPPINRPPPGFNHSLPPPGFNPTVPPPGFNPRVPPPGFNPTRPPPGFNPSFPPPGFNPSQPPPPLNRFPPANASVPPPGFVNASR